MAINQSMKRGIMENKALQASWCVRILWRTFLCSRVNNEF